MAEAMRAADPETIADPLLRSFRHFADEQGEDREALAACAEGGAGGPLDPAALRGVHAPVLVVAGQRDGLAGDPQALAAAFPDGRAVAVPGCDHFSAIPHALTKAAVIDFLDGVLETEDDPFARRF
jgi:pimeloyl-ACP methyl ester carboxylesterase